MRFSKHAYAALGAMVLSSLGGSPALAAIVETSTITNSYFYRINDKAAVESSNSGPSQNIFVTDSDGASVSQLKLNYTATLED